MNIAITGGGTGGHLTIAKAIKEELNRRGMKPIFIGSTYGQDRAWFAEDADWGEKYFLETAGVVNKRGLAKLGALLAIIKASMRVRRIFKEHQIDAVFSVGGYSAAPASFAAIMMGKNYYIHEQNAVMGRLNRLLGKRATMLFSSYHDGAMNAYPIRDVYFENARVREKIERVIFLGGSQGASAINEFALSIAGKLHEKGIAIIHQCGKRDLQKCQTFYHDTGIEVDLFDFSTSLESKIEKADFAICRAGASTVWELTATQLPALFIPYPYAAGNHQYHNAKFLADKDLALLVTQDKLDVKILYEIFAKDIRKMSEGLSIMIEKDGAKKIVDVILNPATTSEASIPK